MNLKKIFLITLPYFIWAPILLWLLLLREGPDLDMAVYVIAWSITVCSGTITELLYGFGQDGWINFFGLPAAAAPVFALFALSANGSYILASKLFHNPEPHIWRNTCITCLMISSGICVTSGISILKWCVRYLKSRKRKESSLGPSCIECSLIILQKRQQQPPFG